MARLYDAECEACGFVYEVLLHRGEHEPAACPCCDATGSEVERVRVHPVATIGPMPSKPRVISQIGETFHTKAQEDAYWKANPDRTLVSANDSSWLAHRDRARNDADRYCRKLGFNDKEDRKARLAKDPGPP